MAVSYCENAQISGVTLRAQIEILYVVITPAIDVTIDCGLIDCDNDLDDD